MGAVKIDTEKDQRKYDVKYCLNDAAGVKALLRDRYQIEAERFNGNTAASDLTMDLKNAILSAGLTDRQTEVIALVYGKWQLTQAEAAGVMGVTQQTVGQALNEAAAKMAVWFADGDYGEVTVTYSDDAEGAAV
jgi:predicted DNA-binding protein (UPF0251 family)